MTKDEALKLALEVLEQLRTPLRVNTALDAYDVSRAITAIKQALALDKKAENARELGLDYEPVGWWDSKIGFFEEKHFDQLQPLYTAPPAAQRPWVGLTDEEILEAAGIDGADTWLFETAYAIEAKLKEKNT